MWGRDFFDAAIKRIFSEIELCFPFRNIEG